MMNKNRTFIKFLLVGVTNTIIDVSIFNILVLVGLKPVLSGIIGTSTAMIISYFLNGLAVFEDEKIRDYKKLLRFLIITAVGVYIIQYSVMFIGQKLAGTQITNILISSHLNNRIGDNNLKLAVLNITKMIGFSVGIAWNYLLYKRYVFINKSYEETA